MKIYLSLLTTLLFGLASAFATGFSNPTNGIYLAITECAPHSGIPGTNEPFNFNDNLDWATYCNTGKVEVWYPIDHAYGVKLKMISPDGKETAKTALGDSFGSKWDRLHDYKSSRLQPIYAWGSFEENNGESSGGILPAPKELFVMKKPGIYTMEIEMQMFRYVATKDTDEWSRNLLRFSPVRIKVENPLEVKTNLPSIIPSLTNAPSTNPKPKEK